MKMRWMPERPRRVGRWYTPDGIPVTPPDPVVVLPVNTTPPAITGTAQEGEVLTGTNGVWSGTAPISFARQWMRGDADNLGDAIPGAVELAYVPTAADAGAVLRLAVTASNAAGSASVDSLPTGVVVAAPAAPSVVTAATISPASGPVGTVFTITNGTYAGVPAPSVSGVLTQAGVPVAVSDGTFTSTGDGALVWTVTATNSIDSVTSTASATVTVAPSVAITSLSSGAPTNSGFMVALRTDAPATGLRVRWSVNEDMTGATLTGPQATYVSNLCKIGVSGCPANQRVYYQALHNNQPIGPIRSTKTAGATAFKFAFASCGEQGPAPTWGHIAAKDPAFFLAMGDTPYIDYSGTDRQVFRDAHQQYFMGATAPVSGTMPWIYMFDDHDVSTNNPGANTPSLPAAQESYREVHPHYPLVRTTGPIYHAFTYGAVRFIVMDLRSERIAGSMISDDQMAWVKSELDAIRLSATLKFGVIVSSVPWISRADNDTWHGFPVDRLELNDYILNTGLERRVAIISGDAHMLAADDGTNNTFNTAEVPSFRVFQSAPLNRATSVKGGPYTTAPIRSSIYQFSTMEVLPVGGELEITVRGYSDDVEAYTTTFTTANGQNIPAPPVIPSVLTFTQNPVFTTATAGTLVGAFGSDQPGSSFTLVSGTDRFVIDGANLRVKAGAVLAATTYPITFTATNVAGTSLVRSGSVAVTEAAVVSKTFGNLVQHKQSSSTQAVYTESGSFTWEDSYPVAPAPGNLLVAMLGVDKASGIIQTPAGWTLAVGFGKFPLPSIEEVSGAMFYRVADGSETAPVVFNWGPGSVRVGNKAALSLIEIEGNFGAGALTQTGAMTSQASAREVTVALANPVSAPAVSMAFYLNDSAMNKSSGYFMTNGFTLFPEPGLFATPTQANLDAGQPLIVGGYKIATETETVSTTVGHGDATDGSIGFIASFVPAA